MKIRVLHFFSSECKIILIDEIWGWQKNFVRFIISLLRSKQIERTYFYVSSFYTGSLRVSGSFFMHLYLYFLIIPLSADFGAILGCRSYSRGSRVLYLELLLRQGPDLLARLWSRKSNPRQNIL